MLMDPNEISFDALFSCSEFMHVESARTSEEFNSLEKFLRENVKDEKVSFEIKNLAENYGCAAYKDAFEQGFCFAVKSIKFMLKI